MIQAQSNMPIPIFFQDETEKFTQSLSNLRNFSTEVLSAIYQGSALSNLPEIHQLKEIARPALILANEGDPVHPLLTALSLSKALPNSQLMIAHSVREARLQANAIVHFVRNLPK